MIRHLDNGITRCVGKTMNLLDSGVLITETEIGVRRREDLIFYR